MCGLEIKKRTLFYMEATRDRESRVLFQHCVGKTPRNPLCQSCACFWIPPASRDVSDDGCVRIPVKLSTVPFRQQKVDNFAPESLDNFDRNGWTTSNGTGGQLAPEFANSNEKDKDIE